MKKMFLFLMAALFSMFLIGCASDGESGSSYIAYDWDWYTDWYEDNKQEKLEYNK